MFKQKAVAHKQHWEDLMVFYGDAHQHPLNIFIHIIGVPIIVLGVLAAATLVPILSTDVSWLIVLGLSAYYLYLDKIFGLTIVPILVALNLLAAFLNMQLEQTHLLIFSAAAFIGGYILQFIGHAIEGKKPTLVQNPIMAMIVAPLFVIAEVYKMMGLRSELMQAVEKRLQSQ